MPVRSRCSAARSGCGGDLNLAAAHADRVAVIADGHVVACGEPAEVLDAELLSEVYRREIEVIAHPAPAPR